MIAAAWVVSALLLVAAACFFRVSNWFRREGDYWRSVANSVRSAPQSSAYFTSLLDWAQDNRPSTWERLRGWQSPESRRVDRERAS